jgi:hypothetical protein
VSQFEFCDGRGKGDIDVAYLIAARQKADHRMIADATTNIAGIEIPSTNPIFLAGVGIHILLGLGCVVTGAVAMLSPKRAGRHPRYGTIYFWCLAGIFVTASGMAVARWAEDYHLFILGTLSFVSAYCGREARRQRWRNWARLHITGMGTSYVLLWLPSTWTTASNCRFGKTYPISPIGYCQSPPAPRSLSVRCFGIRW